MAPKISTIIGGLRIALQALAEKMGVVLRIEGDMAYTDGGGGGALKNWRVRLEFRLQPVPRTS